MGKLKRKGAYCYGDDLTWHQNYSSQVVAKAAEAALIHGKDITEFIVNHRDIYDFMLRTKVPRTSRLVLTNTQAWGDTDFPLQNITRYYVSTEGGALVKVMPPTPTQVAKNPNAPDRRIGICVGWSVHPCNNIADATAPIDFNYYIQEARKLVDPLR